MPTAGAWVGHELENGRYLVLGRLGVGGMGEVYRAHDTKLDIDVVLKVPHRNLLDNPTAAIRFRREIRGLLNLSHPHIVKVQDLGEYERLPFLVMQYLGGGSLYDWLHSGTNGGKVPMPPEELGSWLPTIAGALDFIHQQGFVHRDVKPHNILFDVAGEAYLADLGLIKALTVESAMDRSATLTGTGQVMGTPLYLAPEQCQEEECSGAADQYALAATVYEWLTGRPPFMGPMAIVMAQHMTQMPQPPHMLVPTLPEALTEVVFQGLAKVPEERFANCATFAQAVLAAVPGYQAAPTTAIKHASRNTVQLSTDEKKPRTKASIQKKRAEPPLPAPRTPTPPPVAPADSIGLDESFPGPPSTPAVKRPTSAAIQRQPTVAKVPSPPRRPTRRLPAVAIAVIGIAVVGAAGWLFLKNRPAKATSSEVTVIRPTNPSPETAPSPPIIEPDEKAIWKALAEKIELALSESQFAKLKELLNEADPKAAGKPERIAEIDAWRALAVARDPDRTQERDQAVELLQKALTGPSTSHAADLCLELSRLAGADPAIRKAALATLTKASADMTGNDKQKVDKAKRNLFALEVRRQIPTLGPKTDWKKVLEECRQAEPNGWVLACKGEALIESANGKPADNVLREAQAAVGAQDVTAIGAYGRYARARVSSAANKPDEAATELVEALRLDVASLSFLEERNARSVAILLDGLRSLRESPDAANPMKPPFRRVGDVENAAVWGDLALRIAPKDFPNLNDVKLARAQVGWYKADPRAAILADELIRKPGLDKLGLDAAPLLLAQARSQSSSEEGQEIAIVAFTQFAERYAKSIESAGDSAVALSFFQTVLEPALKLGSGKSGSSTAGTARLAGLHAAIARVIAAQPQAKWPFKDPRARALEAWKEAIRLDPGRAEYWVGHGKANLQLADFKLEDVEADVKKALELAKDLPSAHGLRGHTLLLRSRQESVPAKRLTPARAAVAAYDNAIRLSKGLSSSDRADFLVGRSSARVELANYLPVDADPKEREALLIGAKEDAEAACKIEDRINPDYAYAALGNSREDIAWLLNRKDGYPDAVKAFNQAVNFRGDLATYWLARGRCQYRQVVYGNHDRAILDKAANDLKESLTHSPRPEEKIEASFWLAKVLLAQGNVNAATPYFEIAAKVGSSPSWPIYALDWANIALTEAARQTDPKERTRFLETARIHAEDVLKQNPSPEASRIVGQTYYLNGDPAKALDAYLAGLPLKDVSKADRSHLGLLLARIDCVLVNALDDKVVKLLKPSPAEIARKDAARAVQLSADLPDPTRAYILGLSGLAHDRAANETGLETARRAEYRSVVFDQLSQAIKLAPEHPSAWMWQGTLGTEHMNRGQYKEALALLEDARKRATPELKGVLDSRIKTCKEKLGN